MELQIVGKNVGLSEETRQIIEEKVRKLERHLPNIAKGVVEISREATKSPEDRFIAQITITHSGSILRGEETASDIATAVKSAVDVVDRRIERYKGVLHKKGGKKVAAAVEEGTAPRIVKEKRFALRIMPVNDAADQMELLGHSFFLFINENGGRFALLYRRQDGQYGLIEADTESVREKD